mgnify:CR=1 FL=1
MIMLGVLICAFAMAFKLLVRAEDIFDNVVAIESTYNLMFGMTDLDVFVDYDNNAISTAARVFVAFFFVSSSNCNVKYVNCNYGRFI